MKIYCVCDGADVREWKYYKSSSLAMAEYQRLAKDLEQRHKFDSEDYRKRERKYESWDGWEEGWVLLLDYLEIETQD